MTRPWETVATAPVNEGTMALLKRGEGDFLIRMDNYILMNSKLNLTELALGRRASERIMSTSPRVLIGGLGMGYTLRAALDLLPSESKVIVAELNSVIVDWCRGPLADLTETAIDDPRVRLRIADVSKVISEAAKGGEKYDAIVLDLYQGTHHANENPDDPFYGYKALRAARGALHSKGVFAAWTEERDDRFEKRLERAGFDIELSRPGKGGPRHVIYVGVKTT